MDWITNLAPRVPGMHARAGAAPAGRFWEFRNATADQAELLLYSEIGGWFGTYAEDFVQELAAVTAPNLTVRLNSPGGSVFEGIAIANALRAHSSTVTVQVDGIAASIASVIALAGARLVMMPHTQLMIHDASGLCAGNASDMQQMAELLDLQSQNLAGVYAAKAGGTAAEWRERMQAETWYLAEEAVAAGLADEAIPARPAGPDDPAEPAGPDAQPAARWDLSLFRYAGREAAPAPAATAAASTDDSPHAAVTEPEPVFPPAPAPPDEPAPAAPLAEPTDSPPAEPAPAPADETDEWAASVAHLLPDPADAWAAEIAHLITPDSSSSAATEA
ncbi:head maturation protease, ClpP-related [Streptomyces tremellae]|uniref:ATP-dependent Clp protease proteolytic subunit n=1 Tax=Streptomyces tremellae TaxID=1124239 RepID=A0ABP7EEW1_9ACTN